MVYIMSKCSFRGNLTVVKFGLKLWKRKGEAGAVKAIYFHLFYIGGGTCFIAAFVAEWLHSVKVVAEECTLGEIFWAEKVYSMWIWVF